MTEDRDHERFSELLGPYARGELDQGALKEIEAHLASCPECRLELVAVEALGAGDAAVLAPREQHKLHAAVARALEPREAIVIGGGLAKRSWARRFAPSLSAAALLLLVVIVGASGLTGNGNSEDAAEVAGGSGDSGARDNGSLEQAQEDGDEEAGPAPAAAPEADSAEDKAASLTDTPKPQFHSATRGWVAFASRSTKRALHDYADSYTNADAEKRESRYLALMAKAAPTRLRSQVFTCGREVHEATDEPVLAAYGSLARVNEKKGLLLSFAYSPSSAGPLSSYMVWTWPLGTCSNRLGYTTGEIDN